MGNTFLIESQSPGNAVDPFGWAIGGVSDGNYRQSISISICMMTATGIGIETRTGTGTESLECRDTEATPKPKLAKQWDGIWRWLKVTLLTFLRSEAAARTLEKRFFAFFSLFLFFMFIFYFVFYSSTRIRPSPTVLIKIIFNLWIRDKYSNTCWIHSYILILVLIYLLLPFDAFVCPSHRLQTQRAMRN